MHCSLMSLPSLSFPHLGKIPCGDTPKESYHPDCCVSRMKHKDGSVVVWAAILQHSLGLLFVLDECITAKDCWSILMDHVHSHPHSHQIWIFLSHFAMFLRSQEEFTLLASCNDLATFLQEILLMLYCPQNEVLHHNNKLLWSNMNSYLYIRI